MGKVYISTTSVGELTFSAITKSPVCDGSVSMYATVETDHVERLLDWYERISCNYDNDEKRKISGETFIDICPDMLISTARGNLWTWFHEQGTVFLIKP